jgi:hypothetical protein
MPLESVRPGQESISVTGDLVRIRDLEFEDPVVAEIISRQDGADRARSLVHMLTVGARGMTSMGLGLELSDVDRRVRATVTDALEEGRRQIGTTLTELQEAVVDSLDPDHRASVVARCLGQLETFRAGLSAAVDPAHAGSHTSTLLEEMKAMLGPGGILEQRLRSALDPEADASALAGTLGRLEGRLDQLHQLMAEDRGRQAESVRGTAKGFDYEDEIEDRLRRWARGRGATVERVSASTGAHGQELAGDLLVELADGARIVVEAKHTASLALNGATGILVELRRALDNRRADAAVCLSRLPAFPAEVGALGIYGEVVLAVDDGDDDAMLGAALAIAANKATQASRSASVVDAGLVAERVERVRSLATQLSSSKRALTDISGSVEKVRMGLESIRTDLIEAAADIDLALRHDQSGADAEVIAGAFGT